MARRCKGDGAPFPTFAAKKGTEKNSPALPSAGFTLSGIIIVEAGWIRLRGGQGGRGWEEPGYSCNCRFSDSTSSESALSRATSASILRTACSTVVWSRPPNRRPISGNERNVSVLARYIAT